MIKKKKKEIHKNLTIFRKYPSDYPVQTSITRVQFRKDLVGSLWVDSVQSSCFFRFVERLKRARKWVSGALRNHRPCLMNRFVIFYVSAPRKNSSPFRERAKSRDLERRKWGFLSGPLSKTWLLYLDGISAKLFRQCA